jgi:hypothetical protein
MSIETQEPHFEQLLCKNRVQCTYEKTFNPVAHDIILLSQDGGSRIARNASAGQMKHILVRLNRLCSSGDGGNGDDAAVLVVM